MTNEQQKTLCDHLYDLQSNGNIGAPILDLLVPPQESYFIKNDLGGTAMQTLLISCKTANYRGWTNY